MLVLTTEVTLCAAPRSRRELTSPLRVQFQIRVRLQLHRTFA